jgi:hypothetical protein
VPEDGDHLAGADFEADAVQYLCQVVFVAEVHILKRDQRRGGWV